MKLSDKGRALLIEQLPGAHEGKITWLMRHGDGQIADDLREKYDFKNGA